MKRLPIRKMGMALLVAVLAYGAYVGFRVFLLWAASDRQAWSVGLASRLICLHIKAHQSWPTSWDALISVSPDTDSAVRDSQKKTLVSEVEIDFHADLHDVAKQSQEDFHAMKTLKPPYYEYWAARVHIIHAAREAVKNEGREGTP